MGITKLSEDVVYRVFLLCLALILIAFGGLLIIGSPVATPTNIVSEGSKFIQYFIHPFLETPYLTSSQAFNASIRVRGEAIVVIRVDRTTQLGSDTVLKKYVVSKSLEKEVSKVIILYPAQSGYYSIDIYTSSQRGPVKISWRIEVINIHFEGFYIATILLMIGSLLLITKLQNIREHILLVFTVTLSILLAGNRRFWPSLYYLILNSESPSVHHLNFIVGCVLFLVPIAMHVFVPQIIKRINKLKELESGHELYEIARKYGISKVYIFEGYPNAHIFGFFKHPKLAISKSLVRGYDAKEITKNEIQAIISHEIAHVKNYDLPFVNFTIFFLSLYKLGLILFVLSSLSFYILRIGLRAFLMLYDFRDFLHALKFIISLDFTSAAILHPLANIYFYRELFFEILLIFIIPNFLLFSTIRESELAADRIAVSKFTTKEDLVKALKKIEELRMKELLQRISSLGFNSLSRRHPTMMERIRNLENKDSLALFINPISGCRIGITTAIILLMLGEISKLHLYVLAFFIIPILIYTSLKNYLSENNVNSWKQVGLLFKELTIETFIACIASFVTYVLLGTLIGIVDLELIFILSHLTFYMVLFMLFALFVYTLLKILQL